MKRKHEKEEIKSFSSQQRLAQPEEIDCIVCGKFGEYKNKDTKHNVCSLECMNINTHLNQHRIKRKRTDIIVPHLYDYLADNVHAKLTHYQEPVSIAMTSKSQINYMMKAHSLEVAGVAVPKPLTTFDQLRSILGDKLLKHLEDLGYMEATGIQRQTIPAALAGRDIIALAPSGAGKTCSFLVPVLVHCQSMSRWDGDKRRAGPYALIIAPTRETCAQIETLCQRLALGIKNMRTALLIGGEPLPNQVHRLKRGAQILIGTPGRLLELAVEHPKLLRLWGVQMIVMDRADEMVKPLKQILGKIKDDRQRQLFYFSSCLDHEVVFKKRMKRPIEIKCLEI